MMRRFALVLAALALAHYGLRIADCGDWGLGIVSAQSAPQTAPRFNPQSATATNPQSAIRHPQSAIRNPPSATPNPQSTLRNPSSIRNPPSAIRIAEDATAKYFASIRADPPLLLAF